MSYAKLVEEELKELGQLYLGKLYSKEAGQRMAGQRIIEQLLDEGLITPEQLKRVCDNLADSYLKDLADIHFEDTEDTVGGTPVYSNPVYSNEDEVEIEWEDMPIKEYTPEEDWEDWMTYGRSDDDDTDDTWTNTWITYGRDDTDSQDNTDTDDTDKKRS